jgi:serine/threonine protein kinase
VLNFGDEVGRYRIGAVLGAGRLTRVYSATHVQLGSRYAIKFFLAPHPELQRLMLQEGRAQGRLSHPNIVGVSDVIRLKDGCVGLVMEFVDGPSLERWMRVHGAFSTEDASVLLGQVLDAVGAAHQQGVVHGDLRPGAILLSQDADYAKVADFGIGQLPYQLSGLELPPQSLRWLAPEQQTDPGSATIASDIFSLGCIFFEMLTGQPAFDEAAGRWSDITEHLPDCLPHFVYLIRRSMDPDPARRFQSCSAMLQTLFPDGAGARHVLTPHGPRGKTLIPDKGFLDEGVFQTIFPHEDDLLPETTSLSDITVASTAPPPAAPTTLSERIQAKSRGPARALGLLSLLLVAGLGGWWMGASQEPVVSTAAVAAPSPRPSLRISPPISAGRSRPDEAVVVEAGLVEAGLVETEGVAEGVAEEAPAEARVEPEETRRVEREERTEVEAPETVSEVVTEEAPPEEAPPEEPPPEEPSPEVEETPETERTDTLGDGLAAVLTTNEPEETPPEAAVVSILGSWTGRYDGRPCTLKITAQDGESITGVFIVQLGNTQRRFSLSGTFDGTRFTLSDGRQVRITASATASRISGGTITIGRDKEQGWSVTR